MEQFQYHMRQYEEGRLQMNDDDDEEYGHGFKNSTHAYSLSADRADMILILVLIDLP